MHYLKATHQQVGVSITLNVGPPESTDTYFLLLNVWLEILAQFFNN